MRRLVAALGFALIPVGALAGITCTRTPYSTADSRVTWTVACLATSDEEGAATANVLLNGALVHVEFEPGAGLDANVACTLAGPSGGDILGGALANPSESAPTGNIVPLNSAGNDYYPQLIGTHTLACSGMGAEKTATVYLKLRE